MQKDSIPFCKLLKTLFREKTKNDENRISDDFRSRLDFRRFRSGGETATSGDMWAQTNPQGKMFSGQKRRRLPLLHPSLPQGCQFYQHFYLRAAFLGRKFFVHLSLIID